MKHLISLLTAFILSLTFTEFPLCALGDGGRLTFSESISSSTQIVLPLRRSRLYSSKQAAFQLDGDVPVPGYYITKDDDALIQMFVSKENPNRLFSDLNRDAQCQSNELFTPVESVPPYNTYDSYLFDSARTLIQAGDCIVTIQIRAVVINYSDFVTLYIDRIYSHYKGSLQIDGKDYPAVLAFQSPSPTDKKNNEIIILDTNGDGIYDRNVDQWFSSQGFAYIDSAPWSVKTLFTQGEAQVTLEPYTGPVGTVKIEGEGVQRFTLSRRKEVDSEIPQHSIGLKGEPGLSYMLPAGIYDVREAWLQSINQPGDIVFKLHDEYNNYGLDEYSSGFKAQYFKSVDPGETTVFHLGGPLKETIEANAPPLSMEVNVEYRYFENKDGLIFDILKINDPAAEYPYSNPPFFIADQNKRIIASNQFHAWIGGTAEGGIHYGAVRMPFFAYGTYTATVASDYDIVQTEPVSFTFYPLGALSWSIITLFCGGAIVFSRMSADRVTRSRAWVFVPGLIGLITFLFVDRFWMPAAIFLEVVTMTFLVWGWSGIRSIGKFSFIALLVSVLILGLNYTWAGMIDESNLLHAILYLLGLVIPLIAIRISVQKRISTGRLIAGVLIGITIPLLGIIAQPERQWAPWWFLAYSLGFFSLCAMPFAILLRWNLWAGRNSGLVTAPFHHDESLG